MKYKILEIMPAQIRVEYEDGSWAIVPIRPDATVEDIDDAVSNYDRDFLPNPETLINPNISVGDERTSSKKVEIVTENLSSQFVPSESIQLPPFSADTLAIANYYSEKGDNRLKDALTSNIEKKISQPNFSLDNLIFSLQDSEDIMAQAEAELNAEQS
jgi:hypothetical protein